MTAPRGLDHLFPRSASSQWGTPRWVLGVVLVGCVGLVLLGMSGSAGAIPAEGAQWDADTEPNVTISNLSTDLQPGSSTTATFELTNEGGETANSVETTVTADGGVVIDGGVATDVVGTIEPGETKEVIITASAGQEVSPGDKPLTLIVDYEDGEGESYTTTGDGLTIPVHDRQSFTITELDDTLAVGYDGMIRGEIRNEGPFTLEDGVLAINPGTTSIYVQDVDFALPELEPGESTQFTYYADVSGQTDPAPRQVQFFVEYTTDAGAQQTAGPETDRVTVDDRLQEFAIEIADREESKLPAGETSRYVLEVTNQLPENLSNIDAQLYPEGDLEAPDSSAFINELGPGESAEMGFTLSSSSGAAIENHSIDMDFQYQTERGHEPISDTYTMPVEVVSPPEDEELSPAAIGASVVVVGLLSGGVLWWRRGVSNTDDGAESVDSG